MLSINPDAKRGPRKTLTGIPRKSGTPGASMPPMANTGGRDWPSGAYPLQNLCFDTTPRADRDPAPQFVYNVTSVARFAPGKDKAGRVDAISVETGETLWSYQNRVTSFSPVLATARGLVFHGGLRAHDVDGKVLWQTRVLTGAGLYRHVRGQWPAIRCDRSRRGSNPGVLRVTSMLTRPPAAMPSTFALPQ
jgi:hypothetical protein